MYVHPGSHVAAYIRRVIVVVCGGFFKEGEGYDGANGAGGGMRRTQDPHMHDIWPMDAGVMTTFGPL